MIKSSTVLKIFALLLIWGFCFAAARADAAGDAGKGKQVFDNHMCVECHKGGGNSVKPSKPIKGKAFLRKYEDDSSLIKVIRSGVANSSMPSFGLDVIDDDQMKDLVAYIRSLTPVKSAKKVGKKKNRRRAKSRGR